MEFTMLPSATGTGCDYQFLSTIIFDGELAVDAGSLGLWSDLDGQARIRNIVLTHTHLDHVLSLPVFLENVYGNGPTVVVHGLPEVLEAVRRDLFNNRLFPDLIAMTPASGPFVEFRPLNPFEPRRLGRHTVTLIPVSHPVPTAAVLVRGDSGAVLVATDTGPTDDVWAFAAKTADLKAVLLEVTFPEDLRWLANVSGHLTPAQFATEQAKAPADVQWYAIHAKPRYREQVLRELAAVPTVRPVEPMLPGRVYRLA